MIKNLKARHGVEGHPNGGDDHKHHGDVGDDVGGSGGVRVLNQVPQLFLISAHNNVTAT
jgi:hypothetical protein